MEQGICICCNFYNEGTFEQFLAYHFHGQNAFLASQKSTMTRSIYSETLSLGSAADHEWTKIYHLPAYRATVSMQSPLCLYPQHIYSGTKQIQCGQYARAARGLDAGQWCVKGRHLGYCSNASSCNNKKDIH